MANLLTAPAGLVVCGLAVWLLVFLPVVGLVLAALLVLAFLALAGLADGAAGVLRERRRRKHA